MQICAQVITPLIKYPDFLLSLPKKNEQFFNKYYQYGNIYKKTYYFGSVYTMIIYLFLFHFKSFCVIMSLKILIEVYFL